MTNPYATSSPANPHQNLTGLQQAAQSQRAVLFVFSPRPFSVQMRRPLAYNFDDQFANYAERVLHDGSSAQYKRKITQLIESPLSYTTVVPAYSHSAGVTRMDHLNDYWTFYLVVNDDQPRRSLTAAGFGDVPPAAYFTNSALRGNRTLYYGYFLDEPVNRLTMRSGAPTVNRQARLVVTHKTLIHQQSSYGANGLSVPRYDVVVDNDIVNPGLLHMITSAPLHQLTPDKLLEAGEAVVDQTSHERMFVHAVGENAAINPQQPEFGIRATLSEPRENLKSLLNNIAHANETVLASSRVGLMSEPGFSDELTTFGNHDLYTQTLASRFQPVPTGTEIGLRENELVNMDLIMQMYNPHIEAFQIQRATQWDTMDQTIDSAANTFSSLVMQAAPVILTNAGLAEIAFQYESHSDDMRVMAVSHMASVADNERVLATRAFLETMKTRVFNVLKAARGDFQINLSLQSAGVSHCILNFYADDIVNTAPFEVPTIAGGLNSNLLGTIDLQAHNSDQLTRFVDQMAGIAEAPDPILPAPINPYHVG